MQIGLFAAKSQQENIMTCVERKHVCYIQHKEHLWYSVTSLEQLVAAPVLVISAASLCQSIAELPQQRTPKAQALIAPGKPRSLHLQ